MENNIIETKDDELANEIRYFKSTINHRIGIQNVLFLPIDESSNFQVKVIKSAIESNYSGNISHYDLYSPISSKLNKINIYPLQGAAYEHETTSPKTGKYTIKVKKDNEKLFFEIWNKFRVIDSVLISDKFDFIYSDGVFGSISWSPSEEQIIFTAEKKDEKKIKMADLNLDDQNKNLIKDVENYINSKQEQSNFGESLEKKMNPEIWTFDIKNKKLSKVKNVNYDEVWPSNPLFVNEEKIIFVGFKKTEPKPGIQYCICRRTNLFLIEKAIYEEKDLTKELQPVDLTPDYFCSLSPSVSKSGDTIVFFGAKNQFIEHITCLELFHMNINQPTKIDTLIPQVFENKNLFNGIYCDISMTLKTNFIYSSKGKEMFVFESIYRGKFLTYLYDFEEKSLKVLHGIDKNSSFMLTAVHKTYGIILSEINTKTIRQLHYVSPDHIDQYFINLSEKSINSDKFIENVFYDFSKEEIPHMNLSQISLFENLINCTSHIVKTESGAEGMLWLPKTHNLDQNQTNSKIPLVLMIHGGPHWHGHYHQISFYEYGHLLNSNYAVFIPNYRGSCGFGLDFLRSVLGNAGNLDVEDLISLVDEILKQFPEIIDETRIGATGYSHGGFLASWLAVHPEFSKRLKVAIPINPVIDMPSFIGSSDIPEWIFAEGIGLKKPLSFSISEEDIKGLWRSSPMSLVNNVKCPVLVMIGKSDLRVPPSNGLLFYKALRFLGRKNVEIAAYAGENHSLPGIEASIHSVISMMRFLKKYL